MVKILPVNQFELKTYAPESEDKFSRDYDTTCTLNYASNEQVAYVHLNCHETHLFVLTCRLPSDNTSNYEFTLYVYDLQSVQFTSLNQQQVSNQ